MFERFTKRAINVIMLAQEEARSSGHNYVGSEQILLGLLSVGEGIAFCALQKFNVNLELVRAEVLKITSCGSAPFCEVIPFTPRAKRVLELAWDEARQLGHNYIGTEHLLLGVIREGEGVAPRVLRGLGVDLAELRRTVFEIQLDYFKQLAGHDNSAMHKFGCSGVLLFLLGRYAEADADFSKALLLPGGEVYEARADACREKLRRAQEA